MKLCPKGVPIHTTGCNPSLAWSQLFLWFNHFIISSSLKKQNKNASSCHSNLTTVSAPNRNAVWSIWDLRTPGHARELVIPDVSQGPETVWSCWHYCVQRAIRRGQECDFLPIIWSSFTSSVTQCDSRCIYTFFFLDTLITCLSSPNCLNCVMAIAKKTPVDGKNNEQQLFPERHLQASSLSAG